MEQRQTRDQKKKRWVIKAGSQMVVGGGPMLIRSWMHQISKLKKEFNIEVIWVTSGAIASAIERTNRVRKKNDLSDKQALSAIGQPLVMDLYNISLNSLGMTGGQILLTYDDLADPIRRSNFVGSLEKLLSWNVVPIINENDAVATEEIRFGDNDNLSAKIAIHTGANRLVILTDVEGVYDRDPRENPRAKLISKIAKVDSKLLRDKDLQKSSLRGTGGMFSKLMAAQLAGEARIATTLARGDRPEVLLDLARGLNVGTLLYSESKFYSESKKGKK